MVIERSLRETLAERRQRPSPPEERKPPLPAAGIIPSSTMEGGAWPPIFFWPPSALSRLLGA